MYKFRSRPKKSTSALRPLSGAALLLFTAMSVVAPAQIQHSDARTFSAGLKIKLDRNTPPFAALEDTFMDHLDAQPVQDIAKTESLGSSQIATDQVVSRITKGDETAERRTIAVSSVSRDEILQTLFMPLMQSFEKTNAPMVDATNPNAIDSAASVAPFKRHSFSGPSDGGSNVSPSYTASHVVPTSASAASTSSAPSFEANPGVTLITHVHANDHLNSQATAEALTQSLSRQIDGTIELSEGLALTSPSDQIVVYHEVEDAPEGVEGTVWIREGRYRIQLDNLSGLLVAELRSAKGELLGRGQLDLVDLPLVKSKQFRVSDVALKLVPVMHGLSGTVVSGNAYNEQRVLVPRANVQTAVQHDVVAADARGLFHNEQVITGSTALVQASRSGYWTTIAATAADHMTTLVLLPKAFLKSIAQVVSVMRPLLKIDRNTAIVWGHVTLSGRDVAGAQVQLLNSGDPVAPIYFNEMMIPDPNLKATSSNGLYAFLPVAEGAQAIQATLSGHLSEPVAFPAKKQAVSSIDVEMTLTRRMTLKSFDAFESTHPLGAVAVKLGSTRSIAIGADGLGFMRFAAGSSLMVMDVDAQAPYTPERFVMSRQKTYSYLPMLKAEWLDAVRGGLAVQPGTGAVVGFVQGASTYHVMVDDGSEGAETIVYFDAHGQVSTTGRGEPGGGFAIFNVQEGYRQVSVTYDDSDKISTSVVLADSHVVSVINHSTR